MAESIGHRAAEEVRKNADASGRTISEEMEHIGINLLCYYQWFKNKHMPSAPHLRKMLLAGYDICWILDGGE